MTIYRLIVFTSKLKVRKGYAILPAPPVVGQTYMDDVNEFGGGKVTVLHWEAVV